MAQKIMSVFFLGGTLLLSMNTGQCAVSAFVTTTSTPNPSSYMLHSKSRVEFHSKSEQKYHKARNVILPKPSFRPSSNALHDISSTATRTSSKLQAATLPTPTSQNGFSLRQLLTKFINLFRKILYPHTIAPKSTSSNEASKAPLPQASIGCPFFGSYIFSGDDENGPGKFWRKISQKLNQPGIFNVAFLGKPLTVVYGSDNMKNILDREFKSEAEGGIFTGQMEQASKESRELVGTESLLRSTDKNEHLWLRKLVGQSMNPAAVSKSVPQLIRGAELALEEMIRKGGTDRGVVMEDVCTQYTLDVAWRQILGLSLSEDEVPVFRDAVHDWIIGIINPFLMILPSFIVRRTKSYKAKLYFNDLISSKIEDLKRNGPDGSTLGAMVYATDEDEESGTKQQSLSKAQIIDNALLLILAGSETSASTLTTAMCFLGMYPEIYKKIQKEQQDLQEKYGTDAQLTRQMLDEMPYLDAFIRETARIKPLNQGAPRQTKETLVVDGKQIPGGWTVLCNVLLTHSVDPKTVETDGFGNNMDIYKGFKPERWMDEATKPSAWMAFGYGPRFCLGYNLAMAEMKVFLALVARNVEFSLINGTKDIKWQKMSIIPKPKDGTLINVTSKN